MSKGVLIAKNYFKGQVSELDRKFENSLIKGSTGDTGSNREEIVKKWLEIHLPRDCSVYIGGKIVDTKNYDTKQIDILIYLNSMPQFGSNPKTYYLSEGVSYAMQIKSRLGSVELKEALENLQSVKKCDLLQVRVPLHGISKNVIPTGIFAFRSGFKSVENIIKSLEKHLKQGLGPVNFVYINSNCFIVYNSGTWSNTTKKGRVNLPKGYLIVERSSSGLWRLINDLMRAISFDSRFMFDFQKYFMH